jgi:hypothetical protein
VERKYAEVLQQRQEQQQAVGTAVLPAVTEDQQPAASTASEVEHPYYR